MKIPMLITIFISVVVFSCSKEELEIAPIVTNSQNIEYLPLAIGNYWIYNTYSIDTLGNETLVGNRDSAYINRDTIINGKTHFFIEGDIYARIGIGNLIRSENNSIIDYNPSDSSDRIIFTTNNFGNVFWSDTNTLFAYSSWVKTSLVNTSTNLGNFSCYEKVTEVIPLQQNYPWGTRNQYRYYNKNVGVVINQFYYSSSPNIFESRLINYNLN